MKPMNADLKWFVRELRRNELEKNPVTFHMSDGRNFVILSLRLIKEGQSDGSPQSGRIAVSCDELDLYWDFPCSGWSIDCSRRPSAVKDYFYAKIRIDSGDLSLELDGITQTVMGTRQVATYRDAIREIERLNAELKAKDEKISEVQKDLDAVRYEKLRVEGLISNLRGDLKRLLDP